MSVDDALAAPNATVPWTGVRNYQARNFMRDAMRVGDGVLFYHSSCAEPGIVGIARVASGAKTDPTQFDPTVALLRRGLQTRRTALAAGGCAGAAQDTQPDVAAAAGRCRSCRTCWYLKRATGYRLPR